MKVPQASSTFKSTISINYKQLIDFSIRLRQLDTGNPAWVQVGTTNQSSYPGNAKEKRFLVAFHSEF